MDLSPGQFPDPLVRHGWTPELKARFLTLLAEAGNVRLSARRCGLSAQSAYVLRRRDALFARGWDAAVALGRRHAEHVLADLAIEGVEEEIWYRGELVGTRRRHDTRLLLAHLARLDRLDRQAESRCAAQDSDRFDEIVALVAGAVLPAGLEAEADGLPPTRVAHAQKAAEDAEYAAMTGRDPFDFDDEEEEGDPVYRIAYDAAGARWGDWHALVCDTVDRLAEAGDCVPRDSINVSTSAVQIGS